MSDPIFVLRISPALLFSKSAWRISAELRKHPEIGAMTLVVDPAQDGAQVERGREVVLILAVDETTMALESFLR